MLIAAKVRAMPLRVAQKVAAQVRRVKVPVVVLVEVGGLNPKTRAAEIPLPMEVREQVMDILTDKTIAEEGKNVEMGLILGDQ